MPYLFYRNKSLNEEVSLKLHLWTFWSVFTERNDRFADVFRHFNSSLMLSYIFQFRSETLSPRQRPMRRSVFLETTITDVVNYQKLRQISQLLQIYLDLCRLCKPAIGDVHVYSYPWRKCKIRAAWDFYRLVNKLFYRLLSTSYFRSWFTNLEQTTLNRSQQLPAPYKRLIDKIKQN